MGFRARFPESSLASLVLAYPVKFLVNSIKLRTAIPVGPFAIQGFASSIQAVPGDIEMHPWRIFGEFF